MTSAVVGLIAGGKDVGIVSKRCCRNTASIPAAVADLTNAKARRGPLRGGEIT